MTPSGKNTLSGLAVSQAMRRQVVKLPNHTPVGNTINALIKYKLNALLAIDPAGDPVGVLSKTDIMGAYYAGLPIDTPMEMIMSSPPLFCSPEDALEKALQIMHSKGIYRLYVMDPQSHGIVGALAYPDIVGLLYQYCHACEYSHFKKRKKTATDGVKRTYVKEIMTCGVKAVLPKAPLIHTMEALSTYRRGAILVKDEDGLPLGVISKTDMALAYKHGIDPNEPAATIMSSPVQSCGADQPLEDAIRTMIFSDVHRLFVHQSTPNDIVGVFSLSDAARNRSGSCYACISSRINLETN